MPLHPAAFCANAPSSREQAFSGPLSLDQDPLPLFSQLSVLFHKCRPAYITFHPIPSLQHWCLAHNRHSVIIYWMNDYMNPPLFTILTLSTHCTSQYALNSSFGFPPWWRGSLSLWPAGKGKLHGWCSETACHQWNYSEAQALWLPCVRRFLGLAAFQKMKSEKTSLLYHFSSIHENLGCAKIE